MKNLSLRVSTLFVAIGIFNSCTKELPPLNEQFPNNNKQKGFVDIYENFYSPIPPEKVGYLHNLYLSQAVFIAENNETLDYHFILGKLEYDFFEKNAFKDTINAYLIQSCEEDRLMYIKNNVRNQVFSALTRFERLVDEFPGDFLKTQSVLSEALASIDFSEFNAFESFLLRGFVETLINSAYFWYPKETGGSSYGDSFRLLRGDEIDDIPGIPGWVKADGRGFGWGLVWGTISTGNPAGGALGGIGAGIGASLMYDECE